MFTGRLSLSATSTLHSTQRATTAQHVDDPKLNTSTIVNNRSTTNDRLSHHFVNDRKTTNAGCGSYLRIAQLLSSSTSASSP